MRSTCEVFYTLRSDAQAFGHPFVTFKKGSDWKVQGNWSNDAYDAGTGYPNRGGQNGCLDGG